MRTTNGISVLAALALLAGMGEAAAQKSSRDKMEGRGNNSSGAPGGGRPMVRPSSPSGGHSSPFGGAPSGYAPAPGSERRNERREKVRSFSGGRDGSSSGNSRNDKSSRQVIRPSGPPGGAYGGYTPPQQPSYGTMPGGAFDSKVTVRDRYTGGKKSDSRSRNSEKSSNRGQGFSPGSSSPWQGGRPVVRPGENYGGATPPGYENSRGGKSKNAGGKKSDSRAKQLVVPGQQGGYGEAPAGIPGAGNSKVKVRGGGKNKSDFATGAPGGLPPGMDGSIPGGKRSGGKTGTVIPKGGVAGGPGMPPGLEKAIGGGAVGKGKTGSVIPKGVARGVTGNLPPGLTKQQLPFAAGKAGGFPGGGKAVVLPKQIQNSAVNAFQSVQKNFRGDKPLVIPRLGSAEKSVVVGANIGLAGGLVTAGFSKVLSGNDAMTVFGSFGNPVVGTQPVSLTKRDIVAMQNGYLPGYLPAPVAGFGLVRPPVIPAAIYTAPGYLPPAISVGVGAAPGFSWQYWDGRSAYDHSYASSLFVSIGHTRHNGFDGVLYGGSRYYAFGYGWMDGCIDYGSGRVWVPGFWAPQIVEECRPIPVWLPPVYEQVWTGCCWETIQVDGGYFSPAPATECHAVTRHVWVPGHYEYYYV